MRVSQTKNVIKIVFLVSLLILCSITLITLWHSESSLNENVQYLIRRANGIEEYGEGEYGAANDLFRDFKLPANAQGRWRHLSDKQIGDMSTLGRILYMDEDRPPVQNKTFKILLWKYGNTIHDRHMQRFTGVEIDPFLACEVKNCVVTYEDEAIEDADIVIMHLHQTTGSDDVPKTRKPGQIWAFSTDESPHHTFLNGKSNLPDYNGMFNWSMHYRMDADIPVPYGRTVVKKQINDDFRFNVYTWIMTKKPEVTVTIMGSNCGSQNHRWEYVKELQKWINVDVYGGCGTLECPGHFRQDCPEISRYIFYMSFENSNCDEYITEKLWWNSYAKNTVPIVMGGTKSNYKQLLPPHSYINVDDFATPRDLATYLKYLVNTPTELSKYFQWKKYFDVLNEHAYFQTISYHYCRVCEALNYNDRTPRVYNDLKNYWAVDKDCRSAWDVLTD